MYIKEGGTKKIQTKINQIEMSSKALSLQNHQYARSRSNYFLD